MNLKDWIDSIDVMIQSIKTHQIVLWILWGLLWGVFILTQCLGSRVFAWGILPRTWVGLRGILFAPLLHQDFNHLFYNTIPLIVLSHFLLVNGVYYFIVVMSILVLGTGFFIWLLGRKTLYIGASAVVTAEWGLLIGHMYQRPTVVTVTLGLFSLYFFWGVFLGIFPKASSVAWEGHLLGLFIGILTSCVL